MTQSMAVKAGAVRFPELGSGPLPVEPNVSPGFFELERERLFRRVWLSVGRAQELQHAGSYVVRELPLLRTSVIIVRGKDGKIRGFHNVCKHRGNKLTRECASKTASFVCGFHGWTYSLEGKLVYVTDERQFHGLEKASLGLSPVSVDVWEGFIFINASTAPEQSLADYLGEMADRLAGYPFDDMPLVESWRAEVNANWKVLIQAFQEGYHVEYLHSRTYPDFSKYKTWSEVDIELLGHHAYFSAAGPMDHDPTPAETLAMSAGFSLGYGGEVMKTADELPKGVNPKRKRDWSFDGNLLFPNMAIALGIGWYVHFMFWPISADRSSLELRYYADRPKSPGRRIAQEWGKLNFRDATREDLSTIEASYAMQASGVITHMQISDQEAIIRHWWRSILQYVGDGARTGENVR